MRLSIIATLCELNEHVDGSNACVACPAGSTNVAGDDATSGTTTCDGMLCINPWFSLHVFQLLLFEVMVYHVFSWMQRGAALGKCCLLLVVVESHLAPVYSFDNITQLPFLALGFSCSVPPTPLRSLRSAQSVFRYLWRRPQY